MTQVHRARKAREGETTMAKETPIISVPLHLLEDLRDLYSGTLDEVQGVQGRAGCNIQGGWGDCPTIEALAAFIPQPQWCPDLDLVRAVMVAWDRAEDEMDLTIDELRMLHEQGILIAVYDEKNGRGDDR